MYMFSIFLLLLFSCVYSQPLKTYNVDPDSITVSGGSAGCAMAMQLHVAYSSTIKGAGLLAGGVYYCAQGRLLEAFFICMIDPGSIDLSVLYTATTNFQTQGIIDPVYNLAGDPVFVIHGTNDNVVSPVSSQKVIQFYQYYGANVSSNFNLNAGHGQPTLNYGNPCPDTASPYINNCNYDGGFEVFNTLYGGNLIRPALGQPVNGQLLTYDQAEFINWPMNSIGDTGFIYIPSNCSEKTVQQAAPCKLHVALHGCSQHRDAIGDVYARHGGYLEAAELNNIIVLFPQNKGTLTTGNPLGCWDWWGYEDGRDEDLDLDTIYATQTGPQMRAIKAMIDRVTG